MQFYKSDLVQYISGSISDTDLLEQLTELGLEVDQSKKENNDLLIKLDLTPNRGDCFSLIGIAREVCAVNNLKLKLPKFKKQQQNLDSKKTVSIDKRACSSYLGQIIKLKNKGKTPQYIKKTLKAADIGQVNTIVDITNYVMLHTGQPLHAFDNKKIGKKIYVKFPFKRTKLKLLDGASHFITKDYLTICDEKGAIALAGIMGCANSEVDETTQEIFLESACFEPASIRGNARKLGFQSEASLRFERGVDKEIQEYAINFAGQLYAEIFGGDFSTIFRQSKNHKAKKILISKEFIDSRLGTEIPATKVIKLLKALEFKVQSKRNLMELTCPPHRYDIEIKEDVIEEIARIIGYDNLPNKKLKLLASSPEDKSIEKEKLSKDIFVNAGFNEVINYAFVDSSFIKMLGFNNDSIELTNPMSSNQDVMRPSLVPGLINNFEYNFNRGAQKLRIFEVGNVFTKEESWKSLAGLLYFDKSSSDWSGSFQSSFYDLRKSIDLFFSRLNIEPVYNKASINHLHPGISAEIKMKTKSIGNIGVLHPAIQRELKLPDIVLFEINLDSIKLPIINSITQPPKFPGSERDLSFLISKEIPAYDFIKELKKAGGTNLRSISVIDVYQGKGIDESSKSMTFRLFWQATGTTLEDKEVDQFVENQINHAAKIFKAKLRS
jgi:phenylalanyl-tRNA synthetase beta chain